MKKAASSSVADQIESASGSFEVCLKYVPYDGTMRGFPLSYEPDCCTEVTGMGKGCPTIET